MKSNSRCFLAVVFGIASAVGAAGCIDSLQGQSKKTGSVIGKKTQEVGEFDKNAKQEVSDSKIRADDPILYPLQAYRPMIEKIMKSHVQQALN
ncbi:MAG: hypothetical protein AB7O26_18680, partial [Planctomycetaceae bacterium]